MKDRVWIVLLAVALLGGGTAIGWWAYDRARGDAIPAGIIAASGRIEAPVVRVSAAAGGRLLSLAVREGDRVRRGQVIAELDSRTTQALSSASEAAVAAADQNVEASGERLAALESQRALAETEAERYRRLFARDAAPRQAVDRAEATLAQLRKEVSAARAARELARHQSHAAREQTRATKVQVQESTVLAPVDGVVEDELLREGEMVSPGMPIIVLRRVDETRVKVFLPIAQAQQTSIGMDARAYLESFGDRAFPGTVERVATEAEFTPKDVHMPDDRATLVFAVEMRFPNVDGSLKDGFPADVYIRTNPKVAWPPRAPWR